MARQVYDPPHLLKHFPVPNFHWGLKQDGVIHLAGQGGIGKDGEVPPSLEEQSRLALANIDEILGSFGATNEDIISMNLFFMLSDGVSLGEALEAFVGVKDEMWPGCAPVGLAVPVSELFYPGLMLEVQVIAAPQVSQNADEAEVITVYRQWCQAFQGMDSEAMKALFDQDFSGLVYQAEENAEPLYTWEQIAAYWDAAPGVVDSVPEWRELTRKVTIDGDSAFVYAKLQTHLEVHGAKKPLVGELRCLLGLHRAQQGWRIVHYHESRYEDLAFLFED